MLKPYRRAELAFDLVREIGADGRNSRTYIATDHQLDAEIVVKQVAKANLQSSAQFFEEAKTLYASNHPNVVQAHYACEDQDHIYLAMPYYAKGSVKNLMGQGFLTVRQIISIACQIVSGLHNIHSKQLVHFDIKPDNILLSDRGEALLADFGLAKQMINGLAGQDRFYSKMAPPEVAAGAVEFDQTFDIYQLGLTLYRMCNGNDEFYRQFARFLLPNGQLDGNAFARALQRGTFPDRRLFQPHIPSRLRSTIAKCLEVDPANRFQSALDVANQIATIESRLDWRFSANQGTRIWEQNKSGTQYSLTVQPDSRTQLVKTNQNGRPRRVTAACLPRSTDRDIQRILEDHT